MVKNKENATQPFYYPQRSQVNGIGSQKEANRVAKAGMSKYIM
jgi:hypothetical protein